MKKILFIVILSFLGAISPLTAVNMKTFGGIGIGWSSDSLKLGFASGDEKIEDKATETYPYFELSIGEEFGFDRYNGIQIYASGGIFGEIEDNLNLNKGVFTIGANYVLESGKFFDGLQFALLTGFDMGTRFSSVFDKSDKLGLILQTKGSTNPNDSAIKTSFIMNYNLGLRLRYERYAFSWNVKFPLFSSETPVEINAYIPNRIPLIEGKATSYPIISTFNFVFFL